MKLKIVKFKRIENLELSIPSQIKGGNGIGKSTILEAISFVLTGKDLNGSEFKQMYDNRADIHDALADVSYFDNYGNEWQRIVKPIFQTNRAGVEEIKIKRSTECRKNGIAVNDFSDEFVDFYKFGTDYFFNQKEDLQRSIFIYILKSKLPDYDVNASSLKLKELKRSQKIEVDAVKSLQDANKNTKDVEVPVISAGIEILNKKYIELSTSSNPEKVAEINKRNNDLMSDYFSKKSNLSGLISDIEIKIQRKKSDIETETKHLETVKKSAFIPKATESIEQYDKYFSEKEILFANCEYFENIQDYAAANFANNPVLVENQKKIKDILSQNFTFSGKDCGCPLTKQKCEVAELQAEKTELWVFNSENEMEIQSIKSQNRVILEKEMQAVNSEYNAVKSDLQEAERKLNNIIESNKQIEASNKTLSNSFEISNKIAIDEIYIKLDNLEQSQVKLLTELNEKQTELSALIEPTPEKLPEQLEISDELKQAHSDYELLKVEINKAEGVNEHNAKLRAANQTEIKAKQANLMQILEQIATLTAEISDYFSKLKGIVKSEFAGDIEIDVELLEYVMSKDEYKDCFKITANGKVFPYECNGALQNNVKLQILANLQRLKGYKGITILDNCEANTTTQINTLGLNCILAFATFENELTIK